MSAIHSPVVGVQSSTRPTEIQATTVSTVTAIGAVFAALGSVGFISLNFADSPREAFTHPMSVASGALATLGAVLLGFALVRWRTALPSWMTTMAGAAMVMVAAHAWFLATGIVDIANNTDDTLFEKITFESTWIAFVMAAPKMVLGLVSFVGLAIVGRRRRLVPRTVAVLFGAAGVLALWPPYPPSLLLASLALFFVSRSEMEARV